ncbi:hypothetical protein FB45DRAFT_865712 [Roridomyces roridus]|uniref:Uncharacterized protein n=1 Tax=Roridomyces roridus TaxID=1738132 RepID=A0AAD7BZZ7_9AGAR|nr:hypothetical protein FB45DRAFT_865712 [Roridomyces roridus]
MWDGCSSSIKHLNLAIADGIGHRPEPVHDFKMGNRRSKLESLASLGSFDSIWLRGAQCPFDIRSLEAFKLGYHIRDDLTDGLSGSLETIKLLSLHMSTVNNIAIPLFSGVDQLSLEHACDDWENLCLNLYRLLPEVRDRISVLMVNLCRVPSDGRQTLDGYFSGIHEHFPNLRMMHMNLSPRLTEVVPSAKGYTLNLDPRIAVNFNEFGLPFYVVNSLTERCRLR